MRHVVVTATLLLSTCSMSIAADHKIFTDRFDGIAASATASPLPDPARTVTVVDKVQAGDARSDSGRTGDAPVRVADAVIDIPQQKKFDDVLAPRDLPLPPPKPKPKRVVQHTTEELCQTVAEAAQDNNLPTPFFIRLLFQESKFRPDAVSHAGAQGIAQFMPATADAVGLDNPFDPLQAIPASARLLRDLFERFGNLGLAAAAYNAGPKRIHDWLASKGKLPEETQGYVKTITGQPAEKWKKASSRLPAAKLPPRAPCQDEADLVVANAPEQIPAPPSRPVREAAAKKAHVAKAAHARHKGQQGKSTVNLAARRHARPSKNRVATR
jgi:hypothetical protein